MDNGITPPTKVAAEAFLSLCDRIEQLYGLLTSDEWNDTDVTVYTIYKDRRCKNFYIGKTCVITPIAFREKAQAREFLNDERNVELLKQYLMI